MACCGWRRAALVPGRPASCMQGLATEIGLCIGHDGLHKKGRERAWETVWDSVGVGLWEREEWGRVWMALLGKIPCPREPGRRQHEVVWGLVGRPRVQMQEPP